MNKRVPFPQQTVPVNGQFDMIVCGGGLAGIAAAWNAADRGLKIMLMEYYHKLGGVPVSGMLGIVSGFKLEHEQVVDGKFFRELRERMNKADGCTSRQDWAFRLHPEKLSMALLEMLKEKGVVVLLQTSAVSVSTEAGMIQYVVTASKQGLEAWEAKLIVDDTGDGDLAVMAGCPFEYGRTSDGKVQSSSLTFKLGGIDTDRIPKDMAEATKIWRKEPHLTATNHTVITCLPGTNGEASVNMTHILNCDPLTHEGQLRIREEGAKQAQEIADFFRRNLSGFENCYVAETAMQPGIRESRRIVGDYTLTEQDVISGQDFPDEIARCGWGIDIHVPDRIHGETPMPHFCLTKSFGVPYRCILPQGIRNLYIAGRPISATHEAFAASRINGTCIALGEAIGVAAEMFMKTSDTRAVDVPALQNELQKQHGICHRNIISKAEKI